ncbi:MAG: glycosyltransferase, family [Bryobacterales bacterium]|nr:glycosyltransferase, family [Bryobacterales bacterium]
MSHFGMICPPVAGHMNPLAALGRTLISRGHRVTVFQVAEFESRVRSEELGFAALGREHFPPGTLAQSIAKLAALNGVKSLKYAVECERRISQLILEFAPDAVRASGIDALLVDQNEPAGATVAEHLELPFVSICTSLPLNREPLIPPPFVGWTWRDSNLSRLRNKIGYAISDHFIRPIQEVLNQYRGRWKLPQLRTPDDSFSRAAQLAQMPKEFDFPRERLPSGFHYLGPWFDRLSSKVPFPFEKLDGRPLIYGSLGTLQSKDSHYFRLIAEACAGLNAQLVLSLGDVSGVDVPTLPGNPLVVNYAPQTELLSRAALTITHAGMNTTQQSLYFGVPIIAIPLTHDQPAIAARLGRTGAGIVIPPRQLSYARLRASIEAMLPGSNTYRKGAQRLQDAIRQAGGQKRAADIVEKVVMT